MRELDRAVFAWINHWPELLAPVFHFFSEGIKTTVVRLALVALIVGMVWRGGKPRKAAVLALVAWPLANGLTDVLKNTFHGIRPSVDNPEAIVRVGHLTSYGTASAHAANMAAVAFVFTSILGVWGTPWIAVAILTGLARIYVGVHYPSQVLLGWVCGVFCGFLVVKTWEAYRKVRKSPDENLEDTAQQA